jgi:histidyl-tRNA synthetase
LCAVAAGFGTYYSFDRQVPKQMRHATANNCLVRLCFTRDAFCFPDCMPLAALTAGWQVCVMIGETELQRGAATVRDMTNSQQREVNSALLPLSCPFCAPF